MKSGGTKWWTVGSFGQSVASAGTFAGKIEITRISGPNRNLVIGEQVCGVAQTWGQKLHRGYRDDPDRRVWHPDPSRGRQIRVTQERIQQIKNLVERGKRRREIAELIGMTVGSLQVTCSRLGIVYGDPILTTELFRCDEMIRILNRSPRQALIVVVTVHYCTWNEIRSLGQWSKSKPPRRGRRWSKR